MSKQDDVNNIAQLRRQIADTGRVEDKRQLASSLGALGNSCGYENDFAAAVQHHTEARDIYHSIGDADGEAQAWFNLGATYAVGYHEYQKAEICIQNGLALATIPEVIANYTRRLEQVRQMARRG